MALEVLAVVVAPALAVAVVRLAGLAVAVVVTALAVLVVRPVGQGLQAGQLELAGLVELEVLAARVEQKVQVVLAVEAVVHAQAVPVGLEELVV